MFDSPARRQGFILDMKGAASVVYHDDELLLGEVKEGGETSLVAIEIRPAQYGVEFAAACTCAKNRCHHMFATLRAFDAIGGGALFEGASPIPVHANSPSEVRSIFERHRAKIEIFRRFAGNIGRGSAPASDAGTRVAKAGGSLPARTKPKPKPAKPAPPPWKRALSSIRALEIKSRQTSSFSRGFDEDTQIIYGILLRSTRQQDRPVVVVYQRERLKSGAWGKAKRLRRSPSTMTKRQDDQDPYLLEMLVGSTKPSHYWSYGNFDDIELAPGLYDVVMPRLCATGRCCLAHEVDGPFPDAPFLTWDPGPAWRCDTPWMHDASAGEWRCAGVLARETPEGREQVSFESVEALLSDGLVIFPDRVVRLEPVAATRLGWIMMLDERPLVVKESEQDAFAGEMMKLSRDARIALPEAFGWRVDDVDPIPCLSVTHSRKRGSVESLLAKVRFDYLGSETATTYFGQSFVDTAERRVVDRLPEREKSRWKELRAAGFAESGYSFEQADGELPAKLFSAAAEQLIAQGWRIEAEGARMRSPGEIRVSVVSGVDWFDLAVDCDFDGVKASLPSLLAALQKGERFVELGDGTRGMLPEEWLAKYGPLAELGTVAGDQMRFRLSQTLILDALLAAQPAADLDATFVRTREKLKAFSGIQPIDAPETFHGQLRGYQREGLGWLRFLEEYGFGGCLADDMGLGKTVQVLALLEAKRLEAQRAGSNGHRDKGATKTKATSLKTLVVAPKSLVFNWIDEAKRFTPELRTLDYTGLAQGSPRPSGRRRSDRDHLRHDPTGYRRAQGREVQSRGARRGPGDQESRFAISQSLPPARGRQPTGNDRHSG